MIRSRGAVVTGWGGVCGFFALLERQDEHRRDFDRFLKGEIRRGGGSGIGEGRKEVPERNEEL
jgi:hypothetical protein